MEPSLRSLVTSNSLKWVFVGGKGGVGKTTTSCCLGIQLAKVHRNVLIVSTDPAHNLSDAFNQKFTGKPTLVEGFSNLYCMEIDPANEVESRVEAEGGAASAPWMKTIKEYAGSVPGIDEAMSFVELSRRMETMEFEITVFDTAPTGHTLRLLALPDFATTVVEKLLSFKDRFGGLMDTASSMLGPMAGMEGFSPKDLFAKVAEFQAGLQRVQARLKNPDETTFVCVCIPEFLSLYESERLVQELTRFDIDIHNIVVNQVLFVGPGDSCGRCKARQRMQQKYLNDIGDLYADFHVIKTPLLDEEVRGAAKLTAFGEFLITPYTLETPMPAVLKENGGAGVAKSLH